MTKGFTFVYSGGFEADFERILATLDEQYEQLEKIASAFLIPMDIPRPTVGFGRENAQDMPMTAAVAAALKLLHRDMKTINREIWEDLAAIYEGIAKTKTVDGKRIVSTKQTVVGVTNPQQEKINEIAFYLRDLGIEIKYLMRSGKGSAQVVTFLAVMYASRYQLAKVNS